MKQKIIIKTVSISFFILFFIFIGLYSYIHLNDKKENLNVNFYSLVPQSSIALLEIRNAAEIINQIDLFQYTELFHSLKICKLASYVYKAHKQQNTAFEASRALISFHPSGSDKNQVIYCEATSEEDARIINLIKKSGLATFQVKTVEYRNKNIRIYPLNTGDFLATYYQSGIIALSFQKRLIEEVIDAGISHQGIANDSLFAYTQNYKKTSSIPLLYFKQQDARWLPFDVQISRNAICLSGNKLTAEVLPHGVSDTPIEPLSINLFPRTVTQFTQLPLSELEWITGQPANPIIQQLLKRNTNGYMTYCLFHQKDTTENALFIINIPSSHSEQLLSELSTLPPNTLFSELSGQEELEQRGAIRFYNNALLVAVNDSCLNSYVEQVEQNESDSTFYERYMLDTSTPSHWISMSSTNKPYYQPKGKLPFFPSLLFQDQELFRYFTITSQLTDNNGDLFPTVTLIRK